MAETTYDLFDIDSDSKNEDDPLLEQFSCATKHIESLVRTSKLENTTLLKLYGLYKQSTEGKCNRQKPNWYEIQTKSKWEAWNNLGDMSKSEAMERYIDLTKELDKNFSPSVNSTLASSTGWVNVSSMVNTDSVLLDSEKNIFDHVKEGNNLKTIEMLEKLRTEKNDDCFKNFIDDLDTKGLGLIHWAADRGNLDILKILLKYNADPNLTDIDGQTPLHYAASCSHFDCIKLLLDNGANKCIKDNDNLLAQNLATDDVIKEMLEI